MGMGAPTVATTAPPAPAPPDAFGQMINARKGALRSIAAKRGLGSTYLTTPQAGAPTMLGGGV